MDRSTFRLTAQNVSEAMELSCGAGWNQTPADWHALLELEPEGCLGLNCDGRLAATTTLVCHDNTLAWIGMVLTRAEFQRRGFARQLMERALEVAQGRGIETVKLDATDAGRHLYETLGFRAEQVIERWAGMGAQPRPDESPGGPDQPAIELLDREAFGADRARFLRLLAKRVAPAGGQDAFLMWRPGYRASYLGPCMARNPQAARELVRRRLGAGEHPWFWDILAENTAAARLATDLGFKPVRSLLRMARGGEQRGVDTMVYATGGFEIG